MHTVCQSLQDLAVLCVSEFVAYFFKQRLWPWIAKVGLREIIFMQMHLYTGYFVVIFAWIVFIVFSSERCAMLFVLHMVMMERGV